ncbi:MAG: hypothetical protein ACXWIH_13995, partial [Burkholderiales bacterium]
LKHGAKCLLVFNGREFNAPTYVRLMWCCAHRASLSHVRPLRLCSHTGSLCLHHGYITGYIAFWRLI